MQESGSPHHFGLLIAIANAGLWNVLALELGS